MKSAMLLSIIVLFLYVSGAHPSSEDAPTKFITHEDSGVKARDALLDQLFTGYKAYNYAENATVKFGLALIAVDFDTDHNVLNTNGWLRLVWTDSRLSWNAEETGVKIMRVPSNLVWKPDVLLYNGDQTAMECYQSNVIIYPTGQVLWVPPCRMQTYCNFTTEGDTQKCLMKFGSWTFDGFTMGMELYGNKAEADLMYFMSRKYHVTKNVAKVNEKFYDCCKEPYLDVSYELEFTKNKNEGVCGGD